MESCINCNKDYTSRGMKLHRRVCDKVYLLIKLKEEEQKEKENNKQKIVFNYLLNNLTIGNYLPDDCIKIIYEYLMLKDKNISYFKLFENINNISFVCKNFYINRPNISYLINKIKIELNEKICRSWCLDIYGLNNDDLQFLDFKIQSAGWGITYHLYNLVEVINLAYEKYGTEYDYKRFMAKKLQMKSLSKTQKELIFKKRKEKYDNLFHKYNYKNNIHLEKIYNEYIDYIKKDFPILNTIEEKIILMLKLK